MRLGTGLNVFDQATTLLARHEFSLNHRCKEGKLVREHVTGQY